MAEYRFDFAQWYSYTIEAKDEVKAFRQAEKEFMSDMTSSIASPEWDECHCYKVNEDGEEEEIY